MNKKAPPQFMPFLVGTLCGCDVELLAKGKTFFLDPARTDPLTELRMTELTDFVTLERALRERNSERVSALVRNRAAAAQ